MTVSLTVLVAVASVWAGVGLLVWWRLTELIERHPEALPADELALLRGARRSVLGTVVVCLVLPAIYLLMVVVRAGGSDDEEPPG